MKSIFLPWLRSRDALILTTVLLAVAGLAGLTQEFVVYAFKSNALLNSLILVALLFGSFTIYQQSFKLYRERVGIEWWHDALLRESSKKVSPPAFLENCVVHELVQRADRVGSMYKEALTVDLIESEVERISHRLDQNQELCRFMVGLMVALGLLGTFIGLLGTLVKVSDLVGSIGEGMSSGGNAEASMSNVILGLKQPMQAMGTAFSASMFGLIGSIVLGLQMVRLSASTAQCTTDIRTVGLVAVEVLSHRLQASGPTTIEGILSAFVEQLSSSNKQVSGHLQRASTLSEAALPVLSELGKAMTILSTQTAHFAETLVKTNTTMESLSVMPEVLHQSLEVTRAVLSQSVTSCAALGRIEAGQQDVSKLLNTAVQTLTQIMAQNGQSNDAFISELSELNATNAVALTATQKIAKLQEDQYAARTAQLDTTAARVNSMLDHLAVMQGHLATLPGLTRDLRTMVAELPRRDEALGEFSVAVGRLSSVLDTATSAKT